MKWKIDKEDGKICSYTHNHPSSLIEYKYEFFIWPREVEGIKCYNVEIYGPKGNVQIVDIEAATLASARDLCKTMLEYIQTFEKKTGRIL